MEKLVTKESLQKLLDDKRLRNQVIGRALVRIFERQIDNEKANNTTNVTNNVGFSSADAKQGSITAKTFLKRKDLLDFQVEYWMQPRKDGSPRICKYHRQLNEIAVAKKMSLTLDQ